MTDNTQPAGPMNEQLAASQDVAQDEPTETQIQEAARLMSEADAKRTKELADRELRNQQYQLEREEQKVREENYLDWIALACRAYIGKPFGPVRPLAVWRMNNGVMFELPGEERKTAIINVYESALYRGSYDDLITRRAEELGHTLDSWGYAHTEGIYMVTSCTKCRAIVAIPRDGTAYGPLLEGTCKAKK